MKALFLVGYMGCGKSTLGRKAAQRLGVRFVDTDALVEEQQGASVVDLFRYEGEERFREEERSALEEVIGGGTDCVVSTGGGLPIWRDNMARMNAAGVSVYLKRSAEQIASRLSPYGRQKRPRLRGLSDEELVAFMTRDMTQRERFYTQASATIDCGAMDDFEALNRIVELWNSLK